MATPARAARGPVVNGVPHQCSGCGRPIRWALDRCFNCASASRWNPAQVGTAQSRVQQALEYLESGNPGFGPVRDLSTEELIEVVEMLRRAGHITPR